MSTSSRRRPELGYPSTEPPRPSFDEGEKEFTRQFRQGTAGKDRTGSLTFGLNLAAKDVTILENVERGSVSLVLGRNRNLNGSNGSTFFSGITLAGSGSDISIDGTPIIGAGKLL